MIKMIKMIKKIEIMKKTIILKMEQKKKFKNHTIKT